MDISEIGKKIEGTRYHDLTRGEGIVAKHLHDVYCLLTGQVNYPLTDVPALRDNKVLLGAIAVMEAGEQAGLGEEEVVEDLEQTVRREHVPEIIRQHNALRAYYAVDTTASYEAVVLPNRN